MDNPSKARVVMDRFHDWAKVNKGWEKAYKALSLDAYACMSAAFDELDILKPNMFDAWWLQHNCRFKLGGRETKNMRNLVHVFLTDLHYKKIPTKAPKVTKVLA